MTHSGLFYVTLIFIRLGNDDGLLEKLSIMTYNGLSAIFPWLLSLVSSIGKSLATAESVEVLSLAFWPRQFFEYVRVLKFPSILVRIFFLSPDLLESAALPLFLKLLATILLLLRPVLRHYEPLLQKDTSYKPVDVRRFQKDLYYQLVYNTEPDAESKVS